MAIVAQDENGPEDAELIAEGNVDFNGLNNNWMLYQLYIWITFQILGWMMLENDCDCYSLNVFHVLLTSYSIIYIYFYSRSFKTRFE